MIGLDTNVLVRYITQDDPVQSPKATEILERRLNATNPGFISIVTIAEVAWVLDRAYGFSTSEVAAAIERILQTETLVVQSEQAVFAAMIHLKHDGSAFADALIAELGTEAGCSHTLTFDRKALRLATFKLV